MDCGQSKKEEWVCENVTEEYASICYIATIENKKFIGGKQYEICM